MKKFDNFFYLTEGGNLSINNKYFADDINLQYLDQKKATKFIEDLENLFREINKIYTQQFDKPLWEQLETLLRTNKIYSGSSKIFVEFVKEGKFDLFAQYKKTVGDIDIQFCEDFIEDFELLFTTNNTKLSNSNAPQTIGNFIFYGEGGTGVIQKNCLFGYNFGVNMNNGEQDSKKITYVQIDFEPVAFERGIPTKFSQFSHSASFEDIQEGIKGVFHKFLLQSILDVSNQILVDFKLYTANGKTTTRKNIKKTLYSFSVDRGFRERYVPTVEKPEGTELAKNNSGEYIYLDLKNKTERDNISKNNYTINVSELKFKDLENDTRGVNLVNDNLLFINPKSLLYSQNLDVLFSLLFGVEPSDDDREKFNSFIGLLELLKKYEGRGEDIEKEVYNSFLEKLYSPSAQLLYKRDSRNPKGEIHERDFATKQAAVNKFQDIFTNITVDYPEDKFNNIITNYYQLK